MRYRRYYLSPLALGLVSIAVLSSPAWASTDHYVEIQIDAGKLATNVHRVLTGNSDFCPHEIPCPWSPSSTCMVDQFAIGVVGTWSRGASAPVHINSYTTLNTGKILYTQPLSVRLKTKTCAQNPSCTTTTSYMSTLVYELYVGPDAELCLRSEAATGLPSGVAQPDTDVCLGLDPEQVLALTGDSSGDVSGAALTLSAGGRVALRTEYGRTAAHYNSARITGWQSFIDGSTQGAGATGDWSAFVHQTLLREAFEDRVGEGLLTVPGFELDGPISTTWLGLGAAGGAMTMNFPATLTDTECPNDIGLDDVFINLTTGLNASSDGLAGDGAVAWNADDLDVFLCGMAFGGPVGAIVLAGIVSGIELDLSGLSEGCAGTGDATFSCDQKTHPVFMALGPGQGAKFALANAIGSTSGLTLSGPMTLSGTAALTTEVDFEAPSFGFSQSGCASNGVCAYYGGLSVRGTARLCDVTFFGDTQNIYDVDYPSNLSLPAHFGVSVSSALTPAQKATYNSAPYGLKAMVSTSVGVKTYQSPPMVLHDDSYETLHCGAAKIDKHVSCLKTRQWPWEKIYWGWYPESWIDTYTEAAAPVLNARRVFIDSGYVTDLAVTVQRDARGAARTVTIAAAAYPGVGEGQYLTQALSIPVAVPSTMRLLPNANLVAAMFANGYRSSVALSGQLPPQAVGGVLDLSLTPAQLQRALR